MRSHRDFMTVQTKSPEALCPSPAVPALKQGLTLLSSLAEQKHQDFRGSRWDWNVCIANKVPRIRGVHTENPWFD